MLCWLVDTAHGVGTLLVLDDFYSHPNKSLSLSIAVFTTQCSISDTYRGVGEGPPVLVA